MASSFAEQATEAIASKIPQLTALSHDLHANPELCFAEHHAADEITQLLESEGFAVQRGVGELPTAFDAVYGSGSLHVAAIAEYDALPDVGHACGHNIIAAAGLGTGFGLQRVADDLDLTVHVIGTPAEEGGGGKILMLNRGVFDGIHAALMMHPWSFDRLNSSCLAVDHFDVTFTGRTAHASAAPAQGINASDAMTIAQVGIGLLRQQLRPGDQVHGIVTLGGEAANIIPAKVTGRFMCRSLTLDGLSALRPRVDHCFEAGALATGCELSLEDITPVYSHMEQDSDLLALYRRHAEERGRSFDADDRGDPQPTYSTDMSNISLVIPSIHPLVGIETHGAVNHQPEFAAACLGPSANKAVLDGSIALSLTAIDAAQDRDIRQRLLATNVRRAS